MPASTLLDAQQQRFALAPKLKETSLDTAQALTVIYGPLLLVVGLLVWLHQRGRKKEWKNVERNRHIGDKLLALQETLCAQQAQTNELLKQILEKRDNKGN